jgi:hypothetical protein
MDDRVCRRLDGGHVAYDANALSQIPRRDDSLRIGRREPPSRLRAKCRFRARSRGLLAGASAEFVVWMSDAPPKSRGASSTDTSSSPSCAQTSVCRRGARGARRRHSFTALRGQGNHQTKADSGREGRRLTNFLNHNS